MIKTVNLFDYQISCLGCVKDVELALRSVDTRSNCSYMACANPHSIVVAQTDVFFCEALHSANILLPDGSGIILAARVLGLPLAQKVAGTDFFLELNRQAQIRGGLRYFFLGSSSKVLDIIVNRLNREYPAIEVCGVYSPPFKETFSPEDNQAMLAAINAAKPDVLWVGMTAPKQEKWIYQNLAEIEVPFCGAIGAVFDFYAETKQRSSQFWINLGLEWLPRFIQEPLRLWERNLKSTPIFLSWVLREKIKQLLIR